MNLQPATQITTQQLQELRKEILITIQKNPFPDIVLQAISNLILGFTCTHTSGLNNPDNYDQTEFCEDIIQDSTTLTLDVKLLDLFAFTVAHLPTLDITILTNIETLSNYVSDMGVILKSWMDDKKEKVVAGTLRLHWILTPSGTIHGILYAIVKKTEIKNES